MKNFNRFLFPFLTNCTLPSSSLLTTHHNRAETLTIATAAAAETEMEEVAGSQATKLRGSAEDSIAMVTGTGIVAIATEIEVVTDMATGTVTEVDMGAVLGTESRKHLRSGPDLPWLPGVSRRRRKRTGQPRPLASLEGPSLWTQCRRRRR